MTFGEITNPRVREPWPVRRPAHDYTVTRWEPLVCLVIDPGRIGRQRVIIARREEVYGPGGHYEQAVAQIRLGEIEIIMTIIMNDHADREWRVFMKFASCEFRSGRQLEVWKRG